jgi:hypothetical protein
MCRTPSWLRINMATVTVGFVLGSLASLLELATDDSENVKLITGPAIFILACFIPSFCVAADQQPKSSLISTAFIMFSIVLCSTPVVAAGEPPVLQNYLLSAGLSVVVGISLHGLLMWLVHRSKPKS